MSQTLNRFTIRRLLFGGLCVDGDCNFPERSETLGNLDIDNQIVSIAHKAGVRPGDICVDVGAFVGDTAWALASQCGAKVFAYEPFLDSFVCLLYNTHGFDVHCFNQPTGNGERVILNYDCGGPNYGMRAVRDGDGENSIVSAKIDDLGLSSCKMMKIDCEGSEISTLDGAVETIRKCRPYLLVESFPDALAGRGHTPEQLEDKIKSFGYKLEMMGNFPRWDWYAIPQ